MNSIKKPAKAKRASLPRKFNATRKFENDWERLTHSGKQDVTRLKEVMMLLIANDEPLPAEWSDHQLKGEWSDHRECHVKGDLLLIYQLRVDCVIFVRAGTHSELFKR